MWSTTVIRQFPVKRTGQSAAGSLVPELRCGHGGLWVEIAYPAKLIGSPTEKTSVETSVETPVKTPVKTPEQITLLLAQQPTLTLADVAVALGKSIRTVERAAARLLKDRRLRFVGPKKGGRWEVLK